MQRILIVLDAEKLSREEKLQVALFDTFLTFLAPSFASSYRIH